MLNPKYIALLKNLHGILFGIGGGAENESIAWLTRNFKYREFGVPPVLWQTISQHGGVRHVELPFLQMELITEKLSADSGLDFAAVEAVAMASVFACPLIILSARAGWKLKNAAIYIFRAEKELEEREIAFDVRFCTRAAVELFPHSIEQAQRALSGKIDEHSIVITRRTIAKEDAKKRFWRLGDGMQGEPFVMYFDLLPAAMKSKLQEITDMPLLAMVPGIIIG